MTEFRRFAIPEIIEIVPPKIGDHRGFFSEVYRRSDFEGQDLSIDWIQDNQSFSARPGTVRALHYQAPPVAQDKLVRVIRGAVFDVAVDLRHGSPTYGHWVGAELSAEKWNQLLVPKGFAHGFMTLLPETEVFYKVSAPYVREAEGAILWNDPDLGIAWPEAAEPILSAKDKIAPRFRDHKPVFEYQSR